MSQDLVHIAGICGVPDHGQHISKQGVSISDDMLNLMALCYGASSGHMTLESFISLILRLDCMYRIFKQLSNGKAMNLQESEWIYISMYT